MITDSELVGRIVDRDSEAFSQLMERYRRLVSLHLMRIVPDSAAVDDLAQDVFLRVWQRAWQWDGRGAFKSWLMRIATNLALNYLRSSKRRKHRSLDVSRPGADDGDQTGSWLADESMPSPEALAIQAEQQELVREMLDTLPAHRQELVRLVHEQQMKLADVADTLGIPLGTVKSRLHHTCKQLGRMWQQLYEEKE